MKRGEVCWVDYPPPMGHRPAVLISRGEVYQIRTGVTTIPLTRRIRQIPVEVSLGPADGLPKASVANADMITTVPKELVRDSMTTLSSEKLAEVEQAIKFALDLS